VALIYPAIFLVALNIVGGVGVNLLFGILPSCLLLRYGTKGARWSGAGMILAFLAILVLEVGQEFGLLSIAPEVESWMAPSQY